MAKVNCRWHTAPPDIIIDDGGPTPEQQRITFEELLPHLRPGGVYNCEDIHGKANLFTSFVSGVTDSLNSMDGLSCDEVNPERRSVVKANNVQASLNSGFLKKPTSQAA